MATRLYSIDVGNDETQVTEAVGSAVATKKIELTVDLGATNITDLNSPTGSRKINREEVLEALDKIRNYILKGNWPPA